MHKKIFTYRNVFWLLHLLLFIWVFHSFLLHPLNYMYSGTTDGLKNYFTLQSYITQSPQSGYFKYDAMHYPFGEYIWYTDNSPLIAIIFRFTNLNVFPISNALPLIHAIVLLNVLLAPIVVRKLLKRFLNNELLIIAGTLLLVWTSPQFFRLFIGHYNLSLSIFYFIAISWTFSWYDALKSNRRNLQFSLIITLFCLLFFSATIHLYYLILLGLPLGLFIGFSTIMHYKQLRSNWRTIAMTLLTMVVVAASVFTLIHSTDDYFNLRTAEPDGKAIQNWEAKFLHLYKAKKDVNTLPFLGGFRNYDPENAPYLGSFFWYMGTLVLLLFIYNQIKEKKWNIPKLSRLTIISMLTVVFTFFSAMGNQLGILGFDNFLSPLYYINKVYPAISHFRCLGRISWWCFYLTQIGILVLLDKYIAIKYPKLIIYIILLGFGLMAIDINDYRKMHQSRVVENVFSDEQLERIPDLNFPEYQAILPIPYYTVGAERYAFTIDDNPAWSAFTYQLQLKSELPLMSVKLSRIPPVYVEELFSIFLNDTISNVLQSKLNNKPILVVYDSAIEQFSNLEPAATVVINGPDIIEKYNMEKIFSIGTTTYFKWNVK